MRRAVLAAGITNPAGCHSFRHSQWLRHAGLRPGKATHLLERGQTIRTIQELLGHSDMRTTMSHTYAQPRPAGSGQPRRPFVASRTVGYRGRQERVRAPVDPGKDLWQKCFSKALRRASQRGYMA